MTIHSCKESRGNNCEGARGSSEGINNLSQRCKIEAGTNSIYLCKTYPSNDYAQILWQEMILKEDSEAKVESDHYRDLLGCVLILMSRPKFSPTNAHLH